MRYIDDNNLSLLPHKCVFHGFTNQNFSGEELTSGNFVYMMIFEWVERSCSGVWWFAAAQWLEKPAPFGPMLVNCVYIGSMLDPNSALYLWFKKEKNYFNQSETVFGTALTLDSAVCNYFRLCVMLARSLPNFGNKSEHMFFRFFNHFRPLGRNSIS